MPPVSLAVALDHALDAMEKCAKISTNPQGFFVHVRVPPGVAEDLRAVQRKVLPDPAQHEDIDHVTLVYTRKALEAHPPEKVHAALTALRRIGEQTPPITAKLQGWGYFDGARDGGKPSTALVALVDAPGLEHLHVDMARKLKDLDIEPSDYHVFTPHITLGYLGPHGRAEGELPPLSGKFTIDRAHVAAREHHEVPLGGAKTADTALPPQALARGTAEETEEHHLPPDLTAKIVRDHLEKEPGYYREEEKQASLFARWRKHADVIDSHKALTESLYATHGPAGVMQAIQANPALRSPLLTHVKTLAGAASPRPQHGLFSGVMQTQATPLRGAASGKIGALGEAAAAFAMGATG